MDFRKTINDGPPAASEEKLRSAPPDTHLDTHLDAHLDAPIDTPIDEPEELTLEADEADEAQETGPTTPPSPPAPAPAVIQHATVVIRGMVRVSEFPEAQHHQGAPEGRMSFGQGDEFALDVEDFADEPTNPGATLAELAAAAGAGEFARAGEFAQDVPFGTEAEELEPEELEPDEVEPDEPEPNEAALAEPELAEPELDEPELDEPEPEEVEPDEVDRTGGDEAGHHGTGSDGTGPHGTSLDEAEGDDEEHDVEVEPEEEPEELELDEVEEALLSDAPRTDRAAELIIPPIPKPEQPEPPKVPPKKKRRAWYEALFNDDYLRTVRPPKPKEIDREVDFIERALGLAPGASILDVGCGLGNHANALARRGYQVVGLDLSESMLRRANDEARDEGIPVGFVHGDMREIAFESSFDAVLCWGTTFGYFDDDANQEVIARLYRALKPRGLLLLDVVNRDHVIQQQPNLVWFEGDGCVCMEESKFNYFQSRLQVKRTMILDDGRQREAGYSLRLYPAHELGLLLHQQGFRVAEISGMIATPSVFFGATSPRMIILAERRSRDTQKLKSPPEKRDRSEPPAPPVSGAPGKSEAASEPPSNEAGRSEPPPPPGRSEPPSDPPE